MTIRSQICGLSRWIAASLLFVSGCGGQPNFQRAPVGGVVSLDTKPLKSGMVRFIPTGTNKGPAAVAMVKEGRFELAQVNGPVAGQLRIEIEATGFEGFEIDDEVAYAERAAKGSSPIPPNPIPPQYNKNSTLTIQVPLEGDRNLNFILESQPTGGTSS